MPAVASSRVPLIDSKTVIASAEKPAPPVTAVSTPGWAELLELVAGAGRPAR